MSWKVSISQNPSSARLADVSKYVVAASGPLESPLDTFYRASQELLKVGTPGFLLEHPGMGPLLLVGLVSVTENFFRDLFAGIIRMCPLARAAAADQNVKLGSVVWHGASAVERGAFEHTSFANSSTIISTCKQYLKYDLPKWPILGEFEKVCELRHGIVHSSAMLAGKNATKLVIPASVDPLRIAVGFAELQECAAICTSLVVSVNSELFAEIAKRWAKEWPRQPFWQPTQRHESFKRVWELFFSRRDQANGTIPTPLSLVKCRNEVLKTYV
jgi:hypothetical protein